MSTTTRSAGLAPEMRAIAAGLLVLEPQVAAHADEMFAVLSDAALYEYELAPPCSLAWLRERFARLETRRSADGSERWLNWVVRLAQIGEAIGYVQATVRPDASAAIAYVLASRHWGRGLASAAVQAMIDELADRYGVAQLEATVVRRNLRSLRLLDRFGFAVASEARHRELDVDAAEVLLGRPARGA